MTVELSRQISDALARRFTVEREIGRGGMATVFLAQDRGLSRNVAIKVLEPQIATEMARERFLREVDFASRLTHPNIVPIFEAGEADGLLFYVMPYVDGHSLRVRMAREGALPYEDAIVIVGEVADALDYAHEQGVIHRDIKPENILLQNGHAMVADFGIARAVCISCDENLTVAGVPIGTPGYMSPEQGSGEEVDRRADVYSLGAVLYEMLTGRAPFQGSTIEAIIAARYTEPVPSLRAAGWTLSDSLDQAVQRSLQLEPDDRFPTTREFLSAIRPRISGELLLDTLESAPLPEPDRSVAVIPFANLSHDADNEYFSDGITEDIITQLSKIDSLKVTSRTSVAPYKTTEKNVRDIAAELGVATVVEGSVRRAGNRIRVVAQLIDARRDQHIWAERYDRELTDIFAIQDEIAEQIATALKAKLSPTDRAQLAQKPTDNLEAYNLYLKGRFHWSKFTPTGIKLAIDHFNQAIALDADYALAHAGLADCFLLLVVTLGKMSPHEGMPKARAAAERAITLDPTLGDAHATLGAVFDWYEWDWDAADRCLERALALEPRGGKPLTLMAFHRTIQGRPDQALETIKFAEIHHPVSLLVVTNVALQLYKARRYDEALEQMERVMEMDAAFPPAYLVLTWTYLQLGMSAEALEAARRAADLTGYPPPRRAAIGVALAADGQLEEATQIFDELEAEAIGGFVSCLDLALLAGNLGRPDDAFRLLNRAVDERAPWLTHLNADPIWDVLRDDPRFRALTDRVGLP